MYELSMCNKENHVRWNVTITKGYLFQFETESRVNLVTFLSTSITYLTKIKKKHWLFLCLEDWKNTYWFFPFF